MANIAAAQLVNSQVSQSDWVRTLVSSPLLNIAKKKRHPSTEDLTEWEPGQQGRVTEENYVVTRVGKNSVIMDRKSMEKMLRNKLRQIKASNESETEE